MTTGPGCWVRPDPGSQSCFGGNPQRDGQVAQGPAWSTARHQGEKLPLCMDVLSFCTPLLWLHHQALVCSRFERRSAARIKCTAWRWAMPVLVRSFNTCLRRWTGSNAIFLFDLLTLLVRSFNTCLRRWTGSNAMHDGGGDRESEMVISSS